MKLTYFKDTDTLFIELSRGNIQETRDFDDDTLLELDLEGRICAITVEQASKRTDISEISYKQVGP